MMTSIRSTLAVGLTAALMAFAPVSAVALTTDEAEVLTEQVVDEILGFAKSERTLDEKIMAFRNAMDRYADMPSIARFALGITWRQASDDQKEAYTVAFGDYLAQKYGQQFERFDNHEIEVTGALDIGRRGIVVNSELLRTGEAPVIVEWQFSDRSGEALLVDIVVEGLSLLQTERQEIASKLDARGGDLDQLIADLPTVNSR
jgi:phospholipid transport system substrate-binding protein